MDSNQPVDGMMRRYIAMLTAMLDFRGWWCVIRSGDSSFNSIIFGVVEKTQLDCNPVVVLRTAYRLLEQRGSSKWMWDVIQQGNCGDFLNKLPGLPVKVNLIELWENRIRLAQVSDFYPGTSPPSVSCTLFPPHRFHVVGGTEILEAVQEGEFLWTTSKF